MNIFKIKPILLCAALAVGSAGAHAELALAEEVASAWEAALADAAGGALTQTAKVAPSRAMSVNTSRSAALAAPLALATSPTLADIGLWNFISSIRAQQSGTSLVLLESNLRILELRASPAAATVPLPGAAWFMVIGLLGLAGVKATGRKGAANRSDLGLPAMA